MRCVLIALTVLAVLASLTPACAQGVGVQGGRGAVEINSGGLSMRSNRGSRVDVGQNGLSITAAPKAPDDVVVTRGANGEYYFDNRATGESAVIDMRPGGMTRVQSARGSYAVPTDMVRAYLGDDRDALRFFEILQQY